jgi:hypothetical protein
MVQYGVLLGVLGVGGWSPRIGDPTLIGWLTVLAYFAAAFGCARAARRTSLPSRNWWEESARFWTVLTVLMVALGINKQLDLQTLLTFVGRGLFQRLGLYGERRYYQVAFIAVIGLVCTSLLAMFLWSSRQSLRERWLALTGTVFILGYVVVRAASFHQVDLFISSGVSRLKWNWILELGGIGSVCLGSFRVVRPLSPPGSGDGPEE